uniref:Uncharacterized protein n=1 Tax=Opuntia streptacantha TaxID=393608 RepID=A0A7C9DFU8_OPUST
MHSCYTSTAHHFDFSHTCVGEPVIGHNPIIFRRGGKSSGTRGRKLKFRIDWKNQVFKGLCCRPNFHDIKLYEEQYELVIYQRDYEDSFNKTLRGTKTIHLSFISIVTELNET